MPKPLLACTPRLALAVTLGIAACSAPPTRPAPEASAAGAPEAAAVADHDAIVAAVLDRFAADPSTLSDAGLLPEQGPLYIFTEIGQAPGEVTRIGALPRAARPYIGKTLAELQAEADRRNGVVAFIRIHAITISGDRATVTSGVDVALPPPRDGPRTCCCAATDTYERRGGKWTFASRKDQVCA